MRQFLKLVFLGMLAFSNVSRAQEVERLKVSINFKDLKLSESYKQKIQTTLEHVLGVQLSYLSDNSSALPDIQITNHERPIKYWSRGNYSLVKVPEISILSIDEKVDLNRDIVAWIPDNFSANKIALPVSFDSMEQAAIALRNGRVKAIADFADNQYLYERDLGKLKAQVLSTSKYIYVDFRERKYAERYAENILESNSLNTNGVFEINSAQAKNKIRFTNIVKRFDLEQSKLVTLDYENELILWLMNQLPEFEIDLVENNTSRVINMFKQQVDSCALNLYQKPERLEYAEFSTPTAVYLGLHIFINKSVLEKSNIKSHWRKYGHVNLYDYFSWNQEGLIGYYQNYITYKQFPENFLDYVKNNPQRTIELKTFDGAKAMELLDKNRIQYFIEHPANFGLFIAPPYNKNDYESFPTAKIKNVSRGHIACSKTPIGKRFVKAVNKLLNDTVKRKKFISFYLQRLTPIAQSIFIEEFEKLYR